MSGHKWVYHVLPCLMTGEDVVVVCPDHSSAKHMFRQFVRWLMMMGIDFTASCTDSRCWVCAYQGIVKFSCVNDGDTEDAEQATIDDWRE